MGLGAGVHCALGRQGQPGRVMFQLGWGVLGFGARLVCRQEGGQQGFAWLGISRMPLRERWPQPRQLAKDVGLENVNA